MQVRGHDIGVCSWSIQAGDAGDLAAKLRQLGLEHTHLALGPLVAMDEGARRGQLEMLRASGVQISAGMIRFPGEDYTSIQSIRKTGGLVPEQLWPERREIAIRAGRVAGESGIDAMTLHVGFIPQSNDPQYGRLLGRVCEIAEPVAAAGVSLLLETGQETASELLQFLNDLRCQNVFCNYDAANLILYGVGDPIESIRIVGRHIRHVHLKDAVMSESPGTAWGKEVALGSGQVPLLPLIDALNDVGYAGPLVIECDCAESLDEVTAAIQTLAGL